MIAEVTLNDFLSHKDTKVDVRGSRTIGVIGENGHGKSALLEAIAYAHYGVARDNIQELSRNNGDGSHSVTVRHEDTPNAGDELVVERGCNSSGTGFSNVYWNGDRVAKGKGTTPYVEEVFGQDTTMFFLTSFFGLSIAGYSDTVMKVVPSQRLETLQKIANVFVYSKKHEKAAKRRKSLESQKERKEDAISAVEEVVEDKSDLDSKLSSAKKELKRLNTVLQKSRTELKEVSEEEQRFVALTNERDTVSERLDETRESLNDTETELEENNSRQGELKEEIDELIAARDEIQSEISQVDLSELRDSLNVLSRQQERHQTEKSLKSVATEVGDDVTSCPLCGSPIDHDVIDRWSKDIESLDEEITRLNEEISQESSKITSTENKQSKVEKYKNKLTELFNEADQLKSSVQRLEKRRSELLSEKKKHEDRYAEIERSLGEEYEEARSHRERIEETIGNTQTEIGTTNERISNLEDRIEKSKENRKKIRDKKKELESIKLDLEAIGYVEDAFSRYGIPNSLLQRLKNAIREKATEIYSEFDSGEILVEDVEERGKPGVEFVLYDRKGRRRYRQLSSGEYAVFYLSIRAAISKILEASRDIRVDFLVLDELTANLSPRNAAALMSLVGKVLRNMYPQTFLVSHVKLPEVFDRQFLCVSDNDVSEVQPL